MKKNLYFSPEGESVFWNVLDRKLYRYSEDDIHDKFGGVRTWTSNSGLNSKGFINVKPEVLANLIFINTYKCIGVPEANIDTNNTFRIMEDKYGHVLYGTIFMPYNKYDNSGKDAYLCIKEVKESYDETLIILKQYLIYDEDIKYLMSFISYIISLKSIKEVYYAIDEERIKTKSIRINTIDSNGFSLELHVNIQKDILHDHSIKYCMHFLDFLPIALFENSYKTINDYNINDFQNIIFNNFVQSKYNSTYYKGYHINGRFLATKIVNSPFSYLFLEQDKSPNKDYLVLEKFDFKKDKAYVAVYRNIYCYIHNNDLLKNHLNNEFSGERYLKKYVEYEAEYPRIKYLFNKEKLIEEIKKKLDKKIRKYLLVQIDIIKRNISLEKLKEEIPDDLKIKIEDSIASGNCEYGTNKFIEENFPGLLETTAGELKKYWNNKYVRQVLIYKYHNYKVATY